MARWLPKEALGEFRYILALFGLAGMFSLSGMASTIIRGISQGDTIVVRQAIKRTLVISPLGSLLLFILAWQRFQTGEILVAQGIALSGLIFPAYCLSSLYGPILTGLQKIPRLVKIGIVNNLAFSVCFFLVILHTKTLIALLAAYFGFDLLLRGYLTWDAVRTLPIRGTAGTHIRLGDHLSAIGVLQTIAGQFDQILIQYVAGYTTLANYNVAALLPEQIKDFVNSMGGIFLQRLSRHPEHQKLLKPTRRHFWILFWISGGITAAYAVACPILLPWFFPQYRSQVWPSIFYMIGILGVASVIGLNYLQATHQLKPLWRFYLLNTVIQIGSNLLLIPGFKAAGAVASKILTRLLGLPLSYPTYRPPASADTPLPSGEQ